MLYGYKPRDGLDALLQDEIVTAIRPLQRLHEIRLEAAAVIKSVQLKQKETFDKKRKKAKVIIRVTWF